MTEKAGTITWHSSEEDGGPDVGVSLDLGAGRQLWCGEITRERWQDGGPEIAEIGGDDTGNWLILYAPNGETEVIGKVEYYAGRHLLEEVLAPLLREPRA